MLVPVSVIILTRNEEARIGSCISALREFSEILVLDSKSRDSTAELAEQTGAKVVPFHWNGQYPKKKQWALDNLSLLHDWVLLLDADEILPPILVDEIRGLFANGPPLCAGYFIEGRYVMDGQVLRYGARNRKIALFDRRKLTFPVIDDLDLPMGEIEGHYQPVLKQGYRHEKFGQLQGYLLHDAGDEAGWRQRHVSYAQWERGMNRRRLWPQDPVWWRQIMKVMFRAVPARGLVAFMHSYVFKAGFLDRCAGWEFARRRYLYYRMIEKGR